MALIHSVVPTIVPVGQPVEAGQLGTDGLDFLTALLGLQADAPLEEGQAKLVEDLLETPIETLNFGQDAALPMVAEKTIPVVLDLPVPEAKTANTVPEINTQWQSLMDTPLADVDPIKLKQFVAEVWGNAEQVREVKVEELAPKMVEKQQGLPTLSPAEKLEIGQHHVLKNLAAAKPEVLTGKEKQERPETISVRSEAAPIQFEATAKQAVQTKAERRPFQADPEVGMASAGSSAPDFSDVAIKLDPTKPDVAVSHAKWVPQVLPKVENLVEQGGGKMTLQLDPPEMGKLTIEVTTRGKNVELAIHADSEATRSTIEGGLSDLRLALQTQDLQLTHAEVQHTSESSFGSLHFGQGSSSGKEQESSNERGHSFFGREEQMRSRTLLQNESPVARSRNAGRLDFRV